MKQLIALIAVILIVGTTSYFTEKEQNKVNKVKSCQTEPQQKRCDKPA
ncbi:hypothetical protein [Psychrobium sp. 1_MG-2023]|nr:hypothetical protein [Psychrobium sp. 1_MG-2023]MDP2562308.1 hypothetical protein [Psychrobium sp. 1_MG-2023]